MVLKFGIRKKIQKFLRFLVEKTISIGEKDVKLHLIKDIQISRQIAIYGQNLGVFKTENNEYICKKEKAKLYKNKIIIFLTLGYVVYDAHFVTNNVIWTPKLHNLYR